MFDARLVSHIRSFAAAALTNAVLAELCAHRGIGIASERLEDIFGLFTQVDSSLARSRGA